MAIQSKVMWTSGMPENPATLTMFWDDQTLLITRIVIDNTQGKYPLKAKAVVNANGRTFQTTVNPGDTLDQAIPTNQANRMELFLDAKGRLDGVDWNIGM